MDGATLQSRIYRGYKRAASKVGTPYAVYRAAVPINPIAPANHVDDVNCFFGPNPNFILPHKFKIPARSLYTDGSVLVQGDILVGDYGTFFVGDMQPLLPLQMIRCNDSVGITRLTYITVHQVLTAVATALPAFKQLKKVDQKPVSGVGGATTASTAVSEFFLFLPIPSGVVKQNDIITDKAGNVYTLDTIDNTEIGVVVTMHQASNV